MKNDKRLNSWGELTDLIEGQDLVIERVRVLKTEVAIEGQFELPSLAKLTAEDQIFVSAFLKAHGSIKEMEEIFGVSYPSIKNRLNRIADQLEFIVINPAPMARDVLERLERGDITTQQALAELKK